MEEAIRKNEAQYKSLIEYNPDTVMGIDLEGNFTLVNDSCTRITGYSKMGNRCWKRSKGPLLGLGVCAKYFRMAQKDSIRNGNLHMVL